MQSNEPVSCQRGQPLLNFDVLRLICNSLDKVSDVLSFALTCSTLRKGALQRRLRMSPVVLSRLESVEKFHRFIFADPPSRAPHLHGLMLFPYYEYAPDDDNDDLQNRLVAILEAATRLEYLHFQTTLGNLVCSAVARMTALRDLTVFSDLAYLGTHNPEALNSLMTTLRSPLQRLSIKYCEEGQTSASFLQKHLLHFAPTLTSLSLDEFPFDDLPSSVTVSFAAVRSLSIGSISRSNFFWLETLLRLFPNLDDTLLLKGIITRVDQPWAMREQNKEAQRRCPWPGFDRVICSAALAYLMVLQCPIRRMEIDGPMTIDGAPHLAEALRHNGPRQLLLPITLFGNNRLEDLDGLFALGTLDRLTHLVLFVEMKFILGGGLTGERGNFSRDQLLDSLVGATKELRRLTHLRIIFHHDIRHDIRQPVSRSESESAEPEADHGASPSHFDEERARIILPQDADLYPTAVRFIDAVQTLQCFLMTTCGIRDRSRYPREYWHSSKAWRVIALDVDKDRRTPGTKQASSSWVEIGSGDVEAIIDREELHVHNREKDLIRTCSNNVSK